MRTSSHDDREASSTARAVRVLDFYGLPRPVQERLVASLAGGAKPQRLLWSKGGTGAYLIWLGIAVLSVTLLVAFAESALGSLSSLFALHTRTHAVAYVALVTLTVFSVMRAVLLRSRERALPFVPGVYVFPVSVVFARSARLVVYPLIAGSDPIERLSPNRVAVRAPRAPRVAFTAGPSDIDQAIAEVQSAGPRAEQAAQADDEATLLSLDPLRAPKLLSPIGPRESMPPPKLGIARPSIAIAPLIGLIVGPMLWVARNRESDRRMYETAQQKRDVDTYQLYLDRGGFHADEVARIWLPRAELRDVVATGRVQDIQAYALAHPKSAIQPEIDAALRAALLTELSRARAEGTLGALRGFERRFPNHPLNDELKAAMDAVFRAAFDRYVTMAPDGPAGTAPTSAVKRMLAYSQAHGPVVQVRFRLLPSVSLGRADKFVERHPLFNGVSSWPSRYFEADDLVTARNNLQNELAARFNEAFAPEILHVVVGPTADNETTLPKTTVPTFWITLNVEWAGTAHALPRPRGVFIGVVFKFDGELAIPDGGTSFPIRAEISEPVPLGIFAELARSTTTIEPQVYGAMTKTGFERYTTRLTSTFFRRPAPKSSP